MKKDILKNLLYIGCPLMLALIVSRLIDWPLPVLILIFYGILLFFLIPSDVYSGSTLDYTTKVVNHTYRPEKKEFKFTSTSDSVSIIVVLICLVATLVIWYFLFQ